MNGELSRSGWQRARDGRILAGVCAGFARAKGVSPWVVRAIALLAVVVTLGLAVVVYVILAVILPEEGAA